MGFGWRGNGGEYPPIQDLFQALDPGFLPGPARLRAQNRLERFWTMRRIGPGGARPRTGRAKARFLPATCHLRRRVTSMYLRLTVQPDQGSHPAAAAVPAVGEEPPGVAVCAPAAAMYGTYAKGGEFLPRQRLEVALPPPPCVRDERTLGTRVGGQECG